MSKLTPINEFDIVYMSYDEPNADYNYSNLLEKAPWAKRIHGVKGFDACHKAAARESETDRFVTIDADNIVRDEFFSLELDMSKVGQHDVVSWAARNVINGLTYGNGGIKFWPKHVVENMKTHEISENTRSQTDFCWDIHYHQMNNIYSDVFANASAYQAYRGGFREGCKLGLEGGTVVDARQLKAKVHNRNYKRLLVWASVGADVENGLWSMYGTRLGIYLTNIKRHEWDFTAVRDFEWHTTYFNDIVMPKFTDPDGDGTDHSTGWRYSTSKLWQECVKLGDILRSELGLEVGELDYNGSKFFKESFINPPRLGALVKEEHVNNTIE
jgi:hypothetical protein